MHLTFAALAVLAVSAPTAHAAPGSDLRVPAAKPAMSYAQLLRDTRRLATDTPQLIDEVVARRVRLRLVAVPGDGDMLYVHLGDILRFRCLDRAPDFDGGQVQAMVVRHDTDDGGKTVFTLDRCAHRR